MTADKKIEINFETHWGGEDTWYTKSKRWANKQNPIVRHLALGFIEWFLTTPSHHRVHHARNEKYMDHNYGHIFIVWDRLFGTFIVEDFSGNLSLTLFSENYLKRKHMLDSGNNIFITGRVEERRHQPGIFQINITDIYLLSETMERLSKSIILELKAIQELSSSETKQVLNYLAASKCKLGLLVNFGEDSLKYKRIIL